MTSSALTEAIERALKKTPKGVMVKRMRLYGSRLTGENRPNSDYDFIVDFSDVVSLFEFMDVKFALEQELGTDVDIVTPRSIHPVIKKQVLSTALTVYEK